MAIDIDQSHYNTGTATVAGTAVTGQGTAWLGTIRKGDLFGTHKGSGVRIASVNSNTSLTLAYAVTSLNQNAATYEIQRTPFDVGYLAAIEEMIRLYGIGTLPALATLSGAGGDKGVMLTGPDTAATYALTAFARSFLSASNLPNLRNVIAPGERGVFQPNLTGGDLSPAAVRTFIGNVNGFYTFASLLNTTQAGSEILLPAGFPVTAGEIIGNCSASDTYKFSWQLLIGNNNTMYFRRGVSGGASWTPWVEFLNSGTAPEALRTQSNTAEKQASAYDATVGRGLIFGAFGVGTVDRGTFAPANFSTVDATPAEIAALASLNGFYKLASGPNNIQFPPSWVAETGQTWGVVTGYINSSNLYQYSWQEMTGTTGNRKWMRRAISATAWTAWAEVWHSSNLPKGTQALAEAGTNVSGMIWAAEQLKQAVIAHAPSVPADVYKRSNAIGAVSQSGGVPTGAIIEQGSNAQGSYVKFADGTMVCWRTYNVVSTTTQTWGGGFISNPLLTLAFPAAFVGVPTVAPCCQWVSGEASSVALGFAQSVTSTTVGLYAFSGVSSGGTRLGFIAQGRWF